MPVASLRWELSEKERVAADAVQREWSAGPLIKTLIRAPRLVPNVVRLAVSAAARGVWNDVELAVLIDSERVRQALPGTVRGAAWGVDHNFLEALLPRIDPDWRALEIGCGVGRISRKVAPKVRELVCTDVSRVMIREATAHLAEYRNVSCVQTKGYWLEGLPDASFDLVFAHGVFLFFDLYPAMAMLDAIRRVLRDGGTCVLGFLTIDRPDWSNETVQLARQYSRLGTFGARAARPYTEAQLTAMCEAVGIEVVECGYGNATLDDTHPPLLITGSATGPRRGTQSQARPSDT